MKDTKRYLIQVVRMVLSYNPLRVFLPLASSSGRRRRQDDRRLVMHDFRLATNTLLILFAAFQLLAIGLLADLFVRLSKPGRGRPRGAVSAAQPVPTGNTYDKYGELNPIERRLMATFLAQLDDCAADRDSAADPGSRCRRGRGRRPGGAPISPTRSSPASTCPTHAGRALERQAVRGKLRGHRVAAVRRWDLRSCAGDRGARARARPGRGAARARPGRAQRRRAVGARANRSGGSRTWPGGSTGATSGTRPGHIQHWSRSGFVRLVGRHLDVTTVRSPMPWTMVAARDPRRDRTLGLGPASTGPDRGRTRAPRRGRSGRTGRHRVPAADHGPADQCAGGVDDHEREAGDDRDRGADPAGTEPPTSATNAASRTPTPPGTGTSRKPTTQENIAAGAIVSQPTPGSNARAMHQVDVPISSQAGMYRSTRPSDADHGGICTVSLRFIDPLRELDHPAQRAVVQQREPDREQHEHPEPLVALVEEAQGEERGDEQHVREVERAERQRDARVRAGARVAAAARELGPADDRPDAARARTCRSRRRSTRSTQASERRFDADERERMAPRDRDRDHREARHTTSPIDEPHRARRRPATSGRCSTGWRSPGRRTRRRRPR